MSSNSAGTMKALVIKGPYKVALEQRPIPTCKEPTDVVVKVRTAGLCGSDLHYYHGQMPVNYDFVMGHEMILSRRQEAVSSIADTIFLCRVMSLRSALLSRSSKKAI